MFQRKSYYPDTGIADAAKAGLDVSKLGGCRQASWRRDEQCFARRYPAQTAIAEIL